MLPAWLQPWVQLARLMPSDGFEIVEQCPFPDVAGRTELNKLVGQKILYAFDDEHYGWYIGTIAGTNL